MADDPEGELMGPMTWADWVLVWCFLGGALAAWWLILSHLPSSCALLP